MFLNLLTVLSSRQGSNAAGDSVEGTPKPQLTLLSDINGAFRPGVLTCLMGVSGAGKTTLMDVLASRKTGEVPLQYQGLRAGNQVLGIAPWLKQEMLSVCPKCIHKQGVLSSLSRGCSPLLRPHPEISRLNLGYIWGIVKPCCRSAAHQCLLQGAAHLLVWSFLVQESSDLI